MNSDIMHICVSSDNNYAQHLGVTITSILSSNPHSQFFFHVLDGGIGAENIQKIEKLKKKYSFELEFIRMDEKMFSNCVIPNGTHFSVSAYYRLKIPSLFAHLERVLYLDVDLIVKGDLRPLYNTDMGDAYFAMIEDYYAKESIERLALKHGCYFNSGVTLFNISQLKKEKVEQKCFDFINNHFDKIIFVDQDVINVVADGRILAVPEKYNAQVILFDWKRCNAVISQLKQVCIVHYVSAVKPWQKKSSCVVLRQLYYKNLFKTPWKKQCFIFYLQLLKNKIIYRKKDSHSKRICLFGITIFKKKFFSDGKRKEKKYYFCGIPYYEKVNYDA